MKNRIFIGVLILAVAAGFLIFGLNILKRGNLAKKSAETSFEKKESESYWTCAMHPSVKSDKAGKCPICGMDLIKVEKKTEKEIETPAGEKPQKVLYYRNPMDPSVTSATPMKDTMGMDYIPVYEDGVRQEEAFYGCSIKEFGHCPHCDEGKPDAECICGEHKFIVSEKMSHCPVCKKELKQLSSEEIAAIPKDIAGSLTLTKKQLELSGIATSQIKKEHIFKEIRAVGKIAYDPDLAVAEEEYLIALDTFKKVEKSPDPDVVKRANDLVEKSKFRLKIMGLSDVLISELGQKRIPGQGLILPEDKVWVYADIYEYEIGLVKEGLPVKIAVTAFPGEEFKGVVSAMNPILDPATRSAKVRIEIDNPEKKLKPEMFVDVFIEVDLGEALAVGREAILDTGVRKIVWVDKGGGNFEAREIKTGPEGVIAVNNEKIRVFPVTSGLAEGEYVVTKGNFLLDSQSQLTGGMSVLWGGATEIKKEGEGVVETAPIKTEHKH